jgi:hypothetical protein
MIGIGPHTMTTALWVFVVLLNSGLVLLAGLAIWLAARPPRRRGRIGGHRRNAVISLRALNRGGVQ